MLIVAAGVAKVLKLQSFASSGEVNMVRFNKFHMGELIRNRETNQHGTIVGFRDTAEAPKYQVIVPIQPNEERGFSLNTWSESVLEPYSPDE